MLKVKPIVTVKPDTGTVGMGLPARSRKIGLKNLYKNFFKKLDTSRPMHIAVLHNNERETAEKVAEQVRGGI